MSHCMARRPDEDYRTVAIEVVEIAPGSLKDQPIEVGSVEVPADIRPAREPVWREGILILNALDDMDGFWKAPDRADMIEVQMRQHQKSDACCRKAKLLDLRYTSLPGCEKGRDQHCDLAPVPDRICRTFDGRPAVDDDVPLGMCNQEERNGHFDWFISALIYIQTVRPNLQRSAVQP